MRHQHWTYRISAVLLSLVLFGSPLIAFEAPLSEQTVREAYFLGQRRDERMAEALAPYTKHLPLPQTGPYVSEISLFTPYAQVVDVSRSKSQGYSAQQAAQDYRERGDTLLIRVVIQFTATYGLIEAQRNSQDTGSELNTTLREDDFWKSFRVGLSQNDQWLDPIQMYGEPTYISKAEGGGVLNGATIWLELDANSAASESATVEVFTPDGQHVTAAFDLEKLR